jgi:hypothetical protein
LPVEVEELADEEPEVEELVDAEPTFFKFEFSIFNFLR